MTFDNIKKDINCDCLEGTSESIFPYFTRVLNKDKATDNDFLSKWEKKQTHTDCAMICGLKGVSISRIINVTEKERILKQYSQVFKISPKYRKGVLVFQFKEGAGVTKETPSNNDKNHHTLYKSDGFVLNLIEEIETCYLTA